MALAKSQNRDSFVFFDEEVKALKQATKHMSDDIRYTMTVVADNAKRAKGAESNLTNRLGAATDKLDANIYGTPTPTGLYNMCLKYEDRVSLCTTYYACCVMWNVLLGCKESLRRSGFFIFPS